MLKALTLSTHAASRRALALHRQVIMPVAALLLLTVLVLGVLMVVNAATEDDKARHASLETMQASIDVRVHQLDNVVADYALWNEAVQEVQLHVGGVIHGRSAAGQREPGRQQEDAPSHLSSIDLSARMWECCGARAG